MSAGKPVVSSIGGGLVGSAHIESVVVAPEAVEQEVSVDLPPTVSARVFINHRGNPYLRFDEHQIDEDHDKVIFDVFVGKALAARTLRQSHAFALGSIIGATIRAIQV